MIIVKLTGGLGNQMFQYAAGRRLAHIHATQLKFDLSWLGTERPNITTRNYMLAPFSIKGESASTLEQATVADPEYSPLMRFLTRLTPFRRQSHIREKCFRFDPSILTLSDNVYLDGYWQSERYFADAADHIRSDFTIRTAPDGRNGEVAAAINECAAVSVHIRRGDYVTDAKTAAFHGICPIEYYHEAVKAIAKRVAKPHFFVFSDDPTWVREQISIPHPLTIVDHNGPDLAHEDLRLMSLCRHQIIANSSFSWWGAWLNPRPDKIVIAPSRWFNDPAVETSDLIPASWLRLPL